MYQKCVCFLFLVILAVLSCSGFHIDSLAMADLSKKNHFHTSTNSYSNQDKYVRVDSVQRPHRIRHNRLWRTQAHNRYPKPHIDAFVYPPPPHFSSKITPETQHTVFPPSHTRLDESNPTDSRYSSPNSNSNSDLIGRISPDLSLVGPNSLRTYSSRLRTMSSEFRGLRSSEFNATLTSPTNFPNENLAQIPPTDFAPVISRAQRSSDRRLQNQRRNKWSPKQSEDFPTKAYKAKFVVLVEVEYKNSNESNGFCQRYVKVIKDFKGNAAKAFGLVNKFFRHMLTGRCDLVNQMKNSKKYVLLLNDNLNLLDAPKPKEKLRSMMRKRIIQVCKPGFVPTKQRIISLKEVVPKSRKKIEKKNRILICSVGGFPLPRITWRRKNEVLHHSRSYNVLYKRRQSKLVIKKTDKESLGQYECVAESVNGVTTSKNFTLLLPQPSESFSSDKDCENEYKHAFCQNGGTCFYEKTMAVYGCFCPDNFSGEKCELKKPSNTRFLMMHTPKKVVEKKKRKKKGMAQNLGPNSE